MPIPLATVGLISAGLSAAGTAGSIVASNNANAAQREHQLNMYHMQRGHSLADWALQNEYNSPEAQMARLKKAGLNPNLVYGNGNANMPAAKINPAGAPNISPRVPDFNGLSSAMAPYLDATVKQAQVDNLKAQNSVLVNDAILKAAQVGKTFAETKKTGVDTSMSEFQLKLQKMLENTTLQTAEANLRKTETETDISLARNEREAAMNSSNLREAVERILNLRVQRLEMHSRIANNESQRQLINNQIQEIQHRIHNLSSDSTLKQLDIDLKDMGLPPGSPWWVQMIGRWLGKIDSKQGLPTLNRFKPNR